jgi:hypothetical protein
VEARASVARSENLASPLIAFPNREYVSRIFDARPDFVPVFRPIVLRPGRRQSWAQGYEEKQRKGVPVHIPKMKF